MKFRIVILALVIACMGFISCGKDTIEQETVYILCLDDGTNWRCTEPVALMSDNRIRISGTSPSGQTLVLNVFASGIGDYEITRTNGNYGEFAPNSTGGVERFSTKSNSKGTGLIQISSVNTEKMTVSGNFNFTAYRSDGSKRKITNGKFSNVPYTYYNFTEDTYENSMIYQLNGTEFVASSVTAEKNDTAIIIKGDCADEWQGITISMDRNITEGLHYFGTDIYATFNSMGTSYPAAAGAVTISSHDKENKTVKGIFFFNYIDNGEAKSISNGSFDTKYESQQF